MAMQKHFVYEYLKDSTSWDMAEVQPLVSHPRVHSIDGPMCRRSLKARGSNEKVEFMRKQTRWITSSKEIAEVLGGDGRWNRTHVYMTGKSETACEYPASLVVPMFSAIKRQIISDGAIRVGELYFAGPVPDEGHCTTGLEGKCGVDGIWIDPKLLIAGRKEEMEYMRKMGVFEVVDEKECYDNGCKPLKLKWVDMRNAVRDWSVGRSRRPETETNNLGQKTYSHPCRRRKG